MDVFSTSNSTGFSSIPGEEVGVERENGMEEEEKEEGKEEEGKR